MGRLKSDFAVLLLVTLPEGLDGEGLSRALDPVREKFGLTLVLRTLEPDETQSPDDSQGHFYSLVLYGADHPGIVYRVTEAAARHGLNITDLRTHVTRSPSGPLYSLVLEVDVPHGKAAEAFRADLERLKVELKVDATFEPVESDDL